MKVPVEDLVSGADDIPLLLADLLASADGVSFQDMQSISRLFEKYFAIAPLRDEAVNDIVLAQASRHAIVHAGGVVDRKMMRQLRDAQPRSLKQALVLDEVLSFSPEEVERAANAMRVYIRRLAGGVAVALGS